MYLNFFNLNKEPFQITPDPSFLYMSPGHKEALASIIYGVEKKKGFVLIIGAVGVGKTTILRAYLERAEKERLRTIYLFNANISYYNLIRYIFRELGIRPDSEEISSMVDQLHRTLINEYREGRNVLLLIDEAQNMPIDTLENLRMLSNLETTTEKLIQIVLCAQPEFEKTLNLDELKQLKQRIAIRTEILPLTWEEGLSYVSHRLKRASDNDAIIFTPYALKAIIRSAKGIPRVINVLCDNSLITAFGYGKKKVGRGVVQEILKDFGMRRSLSARWWPAAALVAMLCAVSLYVAFVPVGPVGPVGRQAAVPVKTVKIPAGGSAQAAADKEKSQPAEENLLLNRVVEKGDTLAKLIKDVYGHVDSRMIRMVKKANPHIDNENLIVEGGRIAFPVKK